jgi:hypothetical protein
MPRSSSLFAPLVAVFALGGCFDFGGPGSQPPPGGGGGDGTAKLLIAWTVGGQPPAAASCTGVDHLVLDLDYAGGSVEIAPIPCDLTRFRYDRLPEGDATLRLTALDPGGCEVALGTGEAVLSSTLPTDPDPVIAISTPAACR